MQKARSMPTLHGRFLAVLALKYSSIHAQEGGKDFEFIKATVDSNDRQNGAPAHSATHDLCRS